jgi:elongation factor P
VRRVVLTEIAFEAFAFSPIISLSLISQLPSGCKAKSESEAALGLKGATVSNVTKPAKMETGLVVQVPPFITEGEKIKVNTSEGTYQERA